jgi:hypothetical protein
MPKPGQCNDDPDSHCEQSAGHDDTFSDSTQVRRGHVPICRRDGNSGSETAEGRDENRVASIADSSRDSHSVPQCRKDMQKCPVGEQDRDRRRKRSNERP